MKLPRPVTEKSPMDIAPLLERSAKEHSHLCPRQVLGVRLGLAGMHALGFDAPPPKRKMLVISETDGCFVDGLIAATACTVGHRNLRVVDYGKIAATFIDVQGEHAVRLASAAHVRERAASFLPGESRPYFAQLQAYQLMDDEELLSIREVALDLPVRGILSRPGTRAQCDSCGEEILNGRELRQDGFVLCRACAGHAYYRFSSQVLAEMPLSSRFMP